MDRQVTSPERTRLHVIRPLINAPYVLFIVIMQARMKSYLLLNGITRNSLVNFLHLFLQSLDITYLLST